MKVSAEAEAKAQRNTGTAVARLLGPHLKKPSTSSGKYKKKSAAPQNQWTHPTTDRHSPRYFACCRRLRKLFDVSIFHLFFGCVSLKGYDWHQACRHSCCASCEHYLLFSLNVPSSTASRSIDQSSFVVFFLLPCLRLVAGILNCDY